MLFGSSPGLISIFFGSLVFGSLVPCTDLFGQNLIPGLATAHSFQNYSGFASSLPNASKTLYPHTGLDTQNKYQQQMAVYEADARVAAQAEELRKQAIAGAESSFRDGGLVSLPSHENRQGTQHYRNAYAQLLPMKHGAFSAKKATFIVENAFYEGKRDYEEFDKIIAQTGDFLREKMKELDLDRNSNLAKNYLLFQFFADTMEIRSKGLKHFPFEYDFEDYWGKRDWSKMFVHKLLLTGKGQCNSLPRLYLILAEEIEAEAHLALSPNHSYIKFPDDEGRWHNVELTNNMLSTDAFILNSGYVKVEAIQNKIFMHPMNRQELLSNYFDQLAQGYIHKYGYDSFVQEVLITALEIHPNNITAQLSMANLQTVKLKHATELLGIGKENFSEIRNYPHLVRLYKSVLAQYETVDNLGYAEMPAELYEKWLSSIDKKQEEQINNSFKVQPVKQKKD